MTSARLPKVAGIGPSTHPSAQRPAPGQPRSDQPQRSVDKLAAVQDRLASWLSDLTTLQELNDRLIRADSLDTTLHELLHAGAALVGAQRGVAVLEPGDGQGPEISVGLGLEHSDLGTLETVPLAMASYGRALSATITSANDSGTENPRSNAETPPPELVHADIATDDTLTNRHREVAAQLGIAACYARPLASPGLGGLGSVIWMYDEPAEPSERQRHLAGLYCSFAAELVAKQLRFARAEREAQTLRDALLPVRLPHVPGVRLGARRRVGTEGGGDWYDALALPEGALGLSVGGVTGTGPGTTTVMGRLLSALRAYAVQEGEEPAEVLADLELLLTLTEPARTATALFAHVEPLERRMSMAGAGHCPPLLVGERRLEFVETSLSAPLGMLSCWESPSVELTLEPGETLVLYTDGLLHRGGGTLDQALVRLQTTAALAPPAAREDPDALCEHLLTACLQDGTEPMGNTEDVALLAVRFD